MATVSVRYMVHDVEAAIAFYTGHLDFALLLHPTPTFAMLTLGDLRLLLNTPSDADGDGAGRVLPDGRRPEPGGWNRISLLVEDLPAEVKRLRDVGVTFRSDILRGVAGDQAIIEDPSGNPVELFQSHY